MAVTRTTACLDSESVVTPSTEPPCGSHFYWFPAKSPIRSREPAPSGTPGALRAAWIPTSGSRPVPRRARLAGRRPQRSPSALHAWDEPHA